MHFYGRAGQRIGLQRLHVEATTIETPTPAFAVRGAEDSGRLTGLVNTAARAVFEVRAGPSAGARSVRRMPSRSAPTAFKDEDGVLRVLYREVVIRFRSGTKETTRAKILRKHRFVKRERNPFIRDQFIVHHEQGRREGEALLDVANDWAQMDEVEFAVPNFVSEYRRAAKVPKVRPEQWHLRSSTADDVNISAAWKITQGKPSIVVAVLDDGVELAHPDLVGNIAKDSDGRPGRDFFVPDSSPSHFDPNPKLFKFPYDEMAGNDIHGTPCAGVACASGRSSNTRGAAPKCRVLPVKVFHADDMAVDARVADAIRYAARNADVLSCSWSGPYSPDIEMAISEDAAEGRGGKGVAVFCAAGNEHGPVGYPARLPAAVAVGASTHRGRLASYSNTGPAISVVAPSSEDGGRAIYTSDVALPNRGFNVGTVAAGGLDGIHTNSFGGTSSATPLVAGIAALMLSAKSSLTRENLRDLLQSTADKIDTGYGANGHSNRYGYGRANAGRAVAAAKAFKVSQSSNPRGRVAPPRRKA